MKKTIVTSLGVFLAVLLSAAMVYAGQLSIGYENEAGGEGNGMVALVYFDMTGQALGAFHMELSYDPQVIKLAGVKAGDSPYFGELFTKIDNEAGTVNISGFQGVSLDEPAGNIVIARLSLIIEKPVAAMDFFKELKSEFLNPQGTRISVP